MIFKNRKRKGRAAEKGRAAADLDLLTVTSTELRKLLINRSVTSVDLVDVYLDQIQHHNHKGLRLNAMISVVDRDRLRWTAQNLDREREQGKIRSPLHGIPITVKDNIMTGPELRLPTTVGTYALQNGVAKRNAPIVDALIKAGAIIIGKANLSEMNGRKGFGVTTGWSALGGQTQSPYIVGGLKEGDKVLGHSAPGGSSSGSATSVAAGFAPLALATETDGSIVQSANRAALYGLKATVGVIPTEGTAPWSPLTDSIGGMAKSPQDLAALFEVLTGAGRYTETKARDDGDEDDLPEPWTAQRVGFVDPTLWSFSPAICDPDPVLIQQQREEMEAAISKIERCGAVVERSVPFPSMDELALDGDDALEQLWNYDFSNEWEIFLEGYQDSEIRSLRDIVEFNKQNADKELPPRYPGQQLLEDAVDESKRISADKYREGVHILRKFARTQGIDKTMASHDLDVILGPMDGKIPTIAAAAGYPVGTMPLGYSETNGRPFGMCIVAAAEKEDNILRAMRAWDATIAKRKAPPQMQSTSKQDAVQLTPAEENTLNARSSNSHPRPVVISSKLEENVSPSSASVNSSPQIQSINKQATLQVAPKEEGMLDARSSDSHPRPMAVPSMLVENSSSSSASADASPQTQSKYEKSSTQSHGLPPPSQKTTTATSQPAESKDGEQPSSSSDDAATQWTTVIEEKSYQVQSFIDDLAKHLCVRARSISKDRKALDDISAALPDLLKAFAVRLGYKAQTQVHQDISFFVRQHRQLIVDNFDSERTQPDSSVEEEKAERTKLWQASHKVAFPDHPDDTGPYADQHPDEPDHMSDIDSFSDDGHENNLQGGSQHHNLHESDSIHVSGDGEDADDGTPQHIGMYQRIIIESAEYRWLLAGMEQQETLKRASPVDLMEEVKERLWAALPPQTILSRQSGASGYQVTFDLPWDPVLFWKENFEEGKVIALENVITITGSANDAQATTTFEYLMQTWPVTAGPIMGLVKDLLVSSVRPSISHVKLLDGTELEARMENGRVLITATGPEYTLVEVGHQVIWLAAALRSSPYDDGIAACLPAIREVKSLAKHSFEINVDFSFEQPESGFPSEDCVPGLCWHDMFRNPVMVKGFPILKKPTQGLGLEIPLRIMSALAGSDRLSECGGRTYIKGYSVMFFATEVLRDGDLLIWHYRYNALGNRVPYGDHGSKSLPQISMHQLRTYRHVVGWCTECKIYAGATDAEYDSIKPSDAPSPSSGILLDRITFSFGHLGITGGASLAIATRDVPKHYRPKDYKGMLDWVKTIYVVMWDEGDKIGWLINGTTAVLHLARTALQLSSTDKDLPQALEINPKDLKNHGPDHHPRSAINTLWKRENRILRLWEGSNKEVAKTKKVVPALGAEPSPDQNSREFETEFFLFEHLVKEMVEKVELVYDHQVDKAGQNGINLKGKFRRHLEGWDFLEFLQEPKMSPRQVTLQVGGYGWVNFARSIEAVTFVGKGFGQLIRSVRSVGVCEQWHSVQKGKYYLVASILDLRNIEKQKSMEISHLQWHSPEDPLAKCTHCRKRGSGGRSLLPGPRKHTGCHRDPVQTFLPKATQYINKAKRPRYLDDSHPEGGAVIFENVVTSRFHWKDKPEEDLNEGDGADASSRGEMISENSVDESPDSEMTHTKKQPLTGSETPLTSHTSPSDPPAASGSRSHVSPLTSTHSPDANKTSSGSDVEHEPLSDSPAASESRSYASPFVSTHTPDVNKIHSGDAEHGPLSDSSRGSATGDTSANPRPPETMIGCQISAWKVWNRKTREKSAGLFERMLGRGKR